MRKSILGFGAFVASVWALPALAGGAYCTPDWRPENPDLACTSQIAISPGNDTRINIFLLLQDRAGVDGRDRNYPDLEWRSFYGRNFMRWQDLRNAWFPPEPYDEEADSGSILYGYGDRCQTIDSGRAAFLTALRDRPALDRDELELLTQSRERLTDACKNGPGTWGSPGQGGYFANIASPIVADPALNFMAYLEGSASFYSGEWKRAEQYYTMLQEDGTDPWVAETSSYMIARTRLNEAIATGEDRWGYTDVAAADGSIAKGSEDAFRAYLNAYPEGRYASSARGLIRKALWLQREYDRLGAIYAELLSEIGPAQEEAAQLIEEVDDKWLVRDGRGAPTDPVLLAVDDLRRMRSWNYEAEQQQFGADAISIEEIEAQADIFGDHPELYGFVKANHAFYVAQDYRAVRDLLPDDARRESYTPLAFSRQYLRGLALHALGDRNEEGFWLELINGAKGIYQRPSVELALARLWEQQGKLDKVFASDSAITDARIRRILLGGSAGPDILKQQVRAEDADPSEQAFALFTVLLKQLRHGEYAGFMADYPFASKFNPDDEQYGLWGIYEAEVPPLNLFTDGKWSDGYACPSLAKTAQTLARNPRDVDGRLCLGDFYRLNGFDEFELHSRYEEEGVPPQLGDTQTYPGDVTPRHDFYTAIMADRRASRDQRAYALYRAIRCYAPANHNTCGGDGVEESQRKAWFDRIKRDYGATKWAQGLDYYW